MNAKKKRQNSIFVLIIAVFMLFFTTFAVNAETFPYEETAPAYSFDGSVPSTDVTGSGVAQIPSKETLPSASLQDVVVPRAIGLSEDKDEPRLFWGFVMWILVGVLVATILAVILTAKTKAYRGGGKNRYSSGNKMGGQKHLLNEKYYQNRKRK
ncbi:MAG: hypothetical protein IKJ83_03190 [Ruminococcus sp.]|nr:hypothetical protein [Ruminococcus sp.]